MPTLSTIAAVAALALGAANAREAQADCKACLETTATALKAIAEDEGDPPATVNQLDIQCPKSILDDDQCFGKWTQLFQDQIDELNDSDDAKEALLQLRDAADGGHRRCKKCAKEVWGKKEWKECPNLIKQHRCVKEIEAKYSTLAYDSSSNYLLPTPTPSLVPRGGPSHKLCVKCTNDNWDNEAQDKCPGIIFRRHCQKEFEEVYGYWPYDNAGEFIWQPEPSTNPKTVGKSDFLMPVTTVTVTAGASTVNGTSKSVSKRNEAIGDVTTGHGSKSTSAAHYGKAPLGITTLTETQKIRIIETVKKAECPTTKLPVITTSCTHWTVLPRPSTTEQKSGTTATISSSIVSSASSAPQKSSSSGRMSSSASSSYATDYPAAYPHVSRSQSSSSLQAYTASTPSGRSTDSKTVPKETRPASSASSGSITSGKISSKVPDAATKPADSSMTRNAPSTSASGRYVNSTTAAYSKGFSIGASQSSKATTSATKVPPKQTDTVESGASKFGMALGALVSALVCMAFM